MTVLILARDLDSQVDRLVQALDERGVPVFRTDLVAFPQHLTLDARLGPDGWDGVLATEHRDVRLSEIRSVLYRHPSHFELADGLSRPERRHATAEARCGVGGVLAELDVPWINHPSRESDAIKPRQLNAARKVGLRYPASQVTNKPDAVRDFAASVGGPLAAKTLAASALVESGRIQIAYTRRVQPDELGDLAGVAATAHLFQEFLPKVRESRVTVVGRQVFAVAIHANSEAARVDWRADYPALDYTVVEPPAPVTAGVLAFLDHFGLSFGAFDFAITPNDEWIMLECNPCGAYGWLEQALDLPITSALADLLANGVDSHAH